MLRMQLPPKPTLTIAGLALGSTRAAGVTGNPGRVQDHSQEDGLQANSLPALEEEGPGPQVGMAKVGVQTAVEIALKVV